jgi:Tol biopolymer transport system component
MRWRRPSRCTDAENVAVILLVTLVIAAAGLLFALYKFISWKQTATTNQNQPMGAAPFQTRKMERLTSNGKASDAAISPDGKFVVYVVDDGEKQRLRVRQVFPYSDIQIIEPGSVNHYPGPTFSPDGNYIYYGVDDPKSPNSLYQIPFFGGIGEKVQYIVVRVNPNSHFFNHAYLLSFNSLPVRLVSPRLERSLN